MGRNLKLAMAAVLGLTMLAGMPIAAHAQTDPSDQIIPSLDLDSVDVREALRALFKSVGVSYSIAPEVQGTVTVNMKNQKFDTVLQNILKQVEATYRVEAGVYQIIKREEPGPLNNQTPDTTTSGKGTTVRRKVFVRHADPMFLAALIGQDKGNQNFSLHPEMSTIINTGGGGGGGQGGFGGGGGQGGFGGGGFGGGMGGGGFGGGGGGFGGGGYGGGGGGFGGGRGGGGGGFGGRG